jgi:hypothetical protein
LTAKFAEKIRKARKEEPKPSLRPSRFLAFFAVESFLSDVLQPDDLMPDLGQEALNRKVRRKNPQSSQRRTQALFASFAILSVLCD